MYKLFIALCIVSVSFSVHSQDTLVRCTEMSQLADSLQVYSATDYSHKELFKIYKRQYFLYDSLNRTACLQNGYQGFVPVSVVKIYDTVHPFKMKYSKKSCRMLKGNELRSAAIKAHVNLQKLIDEAIENNEVSLNKYLSFVASVSEHGGEIAAGLTWRILNFWSDKNLSSFIRNKKYKTRSVLLDNLGGDFTQVHYVIDSYPICNVKEYLELYYPETYRVIFNTKK